MAAQLALRVALQHAAQQQLMVKEQNRSPSAAMRISWACDKIVWSMICEGKSFAEVEINKMILNVDRDFEDIGVARFTVRSFIVKNGLAGAKSNTVLCAWNPPAEWGRSSHYFIILYMHLASTSVLNLLSSILPPTSSSS
jgi:hypothetical protein